MVLEMVHKRPKALVNDLIDNLRLAVSLCVGRRGQATLDSCQLSQLRHEVGNKLGAPVTSDGQWGSVEAINESKPKQSSPSGSDGLMARQSDVLLAESVDYYENIVIAMAD